jgi:dihydropteroate synthase
MRACGECIIGSSAQVGLRHSFLMSAPFAPAWGARTYIMGILNATPDSFSGDGLGLDLEAILRRAESFVRDGADLLDVGGESSRPGAEPIPLAEELRRVVPAVEALAARFDTPISVDTSKAEVARQALAAGASMVNDIWALSLDQQLGAVVAGADAWVVLMHNRRAAASRDALGGYFEQVDYQDLVQEVSDGLRLAAARAIQQGVRPERILVDPGLGFGKSYAQNLDLVRRLSELRSLDFPLLVGASRKSFTGRLLALPVERRLETSLATLVLMIAQGADVVRVHDVGPSVRAARMTDEIVRNVR